MALDEDLREPIRKDAVQIRESSLEMANEDLCEFWNY